ncbi:MAG TPA: MetQ/NlpA family ABC transporter substrate-binding protein [Pseudogracilibacillus sp.]|nr:MetQ/NlpA family ABC transporter substrate-binding protein [Pseudogracilibacillus sp.]
MRNLLWIVLVLFTVTSIVACSSKEDNTATDNEATENETLSIKVGVTPGPHEEVMEKVQEIAAEDGLDIELVSFTDYVMPNIALDEGDIDANSFQHKPFLEDFVEERGLDLIDIADTIIFPMGIYSTNVDSLEDIEDGAKLGLPNDPTNLAHALFVFEEAGLITVDEDAGYTATIKDVVDNPLNLEFVELEAAQIPRQLDEVTAAAINTNFAIDNGYTPAEDAIYLESVDSPWVNLIAIRAEDKDNPAIEKLIEAYHTDEVKEFIEEKYPGSLVPAW